MWYNSFHKMLLNEGGTILGFRGEDQRKYETDLKFSRFIMNLEIYKRERVKMQEGGLGRILRRPNLPAASGYAREALSTHETTQ